MSLLASRHFNKKMRDRNIYSNIPKREKSLDQDFYRSLVKFLEGKNMLTLFVSSLCPDCPSAIEEIKKKEIKCEIVDITSSMASLKRFLKERDSSDAFDHIVEENRVGVPCLMRDDEFFFFDGDLDEFLGCLLYTSPSPRD